MSKLIASSLVTIQQLNQLLDNATTNLLSSVAQVKSDALNFYAGSPNTYYTIYQLIADEQLHKSPLTEITVYHTQSMLNQINILAADLQQAITVIDNQDSVITSEIQRVTAQGNAIAAGVMLLLLGGTILLALLLAGHIVRSVKSIASDIAFMRDGDLTRRFTALTKDEIGTLAQNLNDFVLALKSSIGTVQDASAENVRMKESLIVTTEQTSASTTQITANTESIKSQISALDANLVLSSDAVRSISDSIRHPERGDPGADGDGGGVDRLGNRDDRLDRQHYQDRGKAAAGHRTARRVRFEGEREDAGRLPNDQSGP